MRLTDILRETDISREQRSDQLLRSKYTVFPEDVYTIDELFPLELRKPDDHFPERLIVVNMLKRAYIDNHLPDRIISELDRIGSKYAKADKLAKDKFEFVDVNKDTLKVINEANKEVTDYIKEICKYKDKQLAKLPEKYGQSITARHHFNNAANMPMSIFQLETKIEEKPYEFPHDFYNQNFLKLSLDTIAETGNEYRANVQNSGNCADVQDHSRVEEFAIFGFIKDYATDQVKRAKKGDYKRFIDTINLMLKITELYRDDSILYPRGNALSLLEKNQNCRDTIEEALQKLEARMIDVKHRNKLTINYHMNTCKSLIRHHISLSQS